MPQLWTKINPIRIGKHLVDLKNPRLRFFGGGGDTKVDQVPRLLPEQEDFLRDLIGPLSGLIGQGLSPTGPREFAPTSPLQNQAFSGFEGLFGLGQQGLGIAQQGLSGFDPSISQGFLGQAGQALERGLQPVDTQAIQQAFEPSRRMAMDTFNEETIPALLERFGATSGGSGTLQQQLARGGRDLSLGLSAQQAPFIGQAALQAPGIQQAGAGLAGNLAQLPGKLSAQSLGIGGAGADMLSQLFNVGSAQRGIGQEQLDAQYAARQQPNSLLSQFAPLALGTQAFDSAVSQSGGGLMSALGPALGIGLGAALTGGLGGLFGGGAGGGLGGGVGSSLPMPGAFQATLWCDRRIKENIVPIEGALDKVKELAGYTYNYKTNSNNRDGGIMAQDLEKVLPEGVTEVGGVKMVKLDAVLGLLVSAINELQEKN